MAKLLSPAEFLEAKKSGASVDEIINTASKNSRGFNLGIEKEVQSRIKERGTIQDSFKKLGNKSWVDKGVGLLDLATAPISLPISAASNMITSAQAGNSNLLTLAKEGLMGLSGQKRGGASDIYRNTGMGKISSEVAGVATELLVPGGLARQGLKMLGRGSKLGDKGIKQAGELLVSGADDAIKIVGKKVNEAFSSINKTPVDGNKFLDEVVKMPKTLISKIEEEFGVNFEDIAQNLNIEKLRAVKQMLGKIKDGMFGKDTKGATEVLDVEKLRKTYSGFKKLLEETITSGHGNKIAAKAMKAEKDFTEATRAASYLKKTVVEPTTLKPTKGGVAAEKWANKTDTTMRDSVHLLKNAGKDVSKKLNKAVDGLNNFMFWLNASKTAEGAARAFTYGGVAGAVGSKLLNKKYGE
jgi:hypothetical protein